MRPVVPDPGREAFERRKHARPHLGQLVFDARRDLRKIVTHKKPIALQIAQGEGQHPLGDALNSGLQFREAQAMAVSDRQVRHHQYGPLVPETGQDAVRGARSKAGAVGRVFVGTAVDGFERGCHRCALGWNLCRLPASLQQYIWVTLDDEG